MGGRLILVVGPSGAGKDTLIGSAMERLAAHRNIVFAQRMITREADPSAEPHVSISRRQFEAMRDTKECLLCWEAHGLGYVIPAEMRVRLDHGKSVVCNVSRSVVREAAGAFPAVAVIVVDAPPRVRAHRLAARGRENFEDVVARLEREGAELPGGVDTVRVDNSGHIAESTDRFVGAILQLARSPMPETMR